MHMPLQWLLFHSYCQQELVKSIWSKHISPQTCGVYIFIRNTYVCSFVLSLAHFFHSRKSLSIFGVEAHQHSTTSSEYQEAFQHEADESAGLGGGGSERGSAVLFRCAAGFWDHFPSRGFQEAARPISPADGAPVPSWLCSSRSTSPSAGASRPGWGGQGDRGNYSPAVREMSTERPLCSSSLPWGCPVAVTALEA